VNALKIISEFIEKENEKDGVKLILYPFHSFQCLKCNKIHQLRWNAVNCCEK